MWMLRIGSEEDIEHLGHVFADLGRVFRLVQLYYEVLLFGLVGVWGRLELLE
jgi:hypothetical protein